MVEHQSGVDQRVTRSERQVAALLDAVVVLLRVGQDVVDRPLHGDQLIVRDDDVFTPEIAGVADPQRIAMRV